MRRMLADRPGVLRYVLFAIAVTGVAASTRCADDRGTSSPRTVDGQRASIHIKFREAHVHALGLGEQPLFAKHYGSYAGAWGPPRQDPRDRWMRVDVPASEAASVVAQLEQDVAIEQAFVAPEITLPRSERVRDDDE
ncbi:MAG TPA: hypothetical protein VMZ53_12470, partial [Kofleriaceae bacterium]|nr:hypothetical protein [Kofleriaceae bacterium]